MEHLEHALVRHQVEERLEVDAGGERIDHHRLVARRQLRHAEQRVVGGLAEEFGVDGDEGMLRASRSQVVASSSVVVISSMPGLHSGLKMAAPRLH